MADNNTINFNQVPKAGKFNSVIDAVNANFDLAKIAILNMKGKSAYEIWREQDGNEGKTVEEFLASLKESGFTTETVDSLPMTNISHTTIYAVPEWSEGLDPQEDESDMWAEYIRVDNVWKLLAKHNGSGLSSLIGNVSNLNKRQTDNDYLSDIVSSNLSNYVQQRVIAADGSSAVNENWGHSLYISVQNGDVIEWDSGATHTGRLDIYDSDKNSLTRDNFVCNPCPRTITINKENAVYIRASFLLSYISSAYIKIIRNNTIVSEWKPVINVLQTKAQLLSNEQIDTVLNNLDIKASIENSNIIHFIGKGDYAVFGNLNRNGLIAGHTYRFWIKDPEWSTEGITLTTSGYSKFNIFFYNNREGKKSDDGEEYTRIRLLEDSVNMTQSVNSFYDYTLPIIKNGRGEDIKEWWVCPYGRAAVGVDVVIIIQDITILQPEKESGDDTNPESDWMSGRPAVYSYENIISSFEEISELSNKLMSIDNQGGKQLDAIDTVTVLGYRTFKIPLDNVGSIDVRQFPYSDKYGSIFFNENDEVIYGICSVTKAANTKDKYFDEWKRNYIAGGISYLLLTLPQDFAESDVLVLYQKGYSHEISETEKRIGSTIRIDTHETVGGSLLEMGVTCVEPLGMKFDGNGTFIEQLGTGRTIANSSTNSGLRYIYCMNLDGCQKIKVDAWRTSSNYPFGLFLDKDMNIVKKMTTSISGLTDWIEVPYGCVYFIYIVIINADTGRKLYVEAVYGGLDSKVNSNTARIEALESGSGSGAVSVHGVRLYQGKIDGNGNPVASDEYVYTSPIQGGRGFFLTLNEGYEIDCGHLFDDEGNLLAYNYINGADNGTHPAVDYYRRYPRTENQQTIGTIADNFFSDGRRRFWGNKTIPSGYALVFVIRKYDSPREASDTQGLGAVDIRPSDKMIDQFCYMDDGRLTSMIPDGIASSKLEIARKRIYQLASIGWQALAQIYAAGNDRMAEVFAQGKYRFGIPYSEAAQYSKYVGQHVSFYTYLTAIHNRRSVMYTERIAGAGQSEYGFSYNGLGNDYTASFYGSVCTALTGYVMGLANVWISRSYRWNTNTIGLTIVQSYESTNETEPHTIVRPLDIIWYSGHCSIVEDVVLDRNGKVKFIVWAEEIKPTPSIAPLTPELFDYRIRERKAIIYRKSDWSSLNEPEATPFIQTDWMDYPKELKYNDDICTMYGDKPCLAVGDILYLNFNKTKEYTNIVIEKESNGVYSVYDTIVLANNANVTTATGEDTYSDINLASLNLSAGKYRAKLTGNDIESDYTHWEMIGITLSVSKNGSGIDVSFSAIGGTPYLLRQENMSGYMVVNDNRVRDIETEDIAPGSIEGLAWGAVSNVNSMIKLFVRGDYGVAVKMVAHPDNV